MGGYGSGGQRVGAGRRAKRTHERLLTGSEGRTRALDDVTPVDLETIPVPSDLTAAQRLAWDEMAPYAAEAGTLTPATACAFRDLCEIVALRRSMLAQLSLDGLMVNAVKVDEETGARFSLGSPVAHPLLAHERQYRLREEAGRARFMLAPVGKPMASSEAPVDPFAEFAGPTLAVSNE